MFSQDKHFSSRNELTFKKVLRTFTKEVGNIEDSTDHGHKGRV